MSDADARRGRVVQDLFGRRAAVEEIAAVWGRGAVVTEPVPLRGLLRVEVVLIVEDGAWVHPLDLVREGYPAKACVCVSN